jgi:beta-galactosidase
VLAGAGDEPVLAGLPERVEAMRRGALLTLINHGGDPVEVPVEGVDAISGQRVERVRLDTFGWAMVCRS